MKILEEDIEFSGFVSGTTHIGKRIISILETKGGEVLRKNPAYEHSINRMTGYAMKFDANDVIEIRFSTLRKNGKAAELLAYLTDVKLGERQHERK